MDFFNTAVLGSMSLYDAMAYFLLYSFLGWCSEVVYVAAASGKLVNRGFLNGPVCPIYGFGVVAVLWLLHPLEPPAAVFRWRRCGQRRGAGGRLGTVQAVPHPLVGLHPAPL